VKSEKRRGEKNFKQTPPQKQKKVSEVTSNLELTEASRDSDNRTHGNSKWKSKRRDLAPFRDRDPPQNEVGQGHKQNYDHYRRQGGKKGIRERGVGKEQI